MIKKLLFSIIAVMIGNFIQAQSPSSQPDVYYLNVFISADKSVYIENEKTKFENIEKKVSEKIRNRSFNINEIIVYRIFADENLKLGYIIDVNQKLNSAYGERVRTERYLLNTVELNIDGQNWFDSINIEKLEKS